MVGAFVGAKSCSGWGWSMVSLPGHCSELVPVGRTASVWFLVCAYSFGHGIYCTLGFSSPWNTFSACVLLGSSSPWRGSVWVSGPSKLGCTWGALWGLRERMVFLVCRRDVSAQIFQYSCLWPSCSLDSLWTLFLLVATLLKAWDDLVFLYTILVGPFQFSKFCDSVSLFGLSSFSSCANILPAHYNLQHSQVKVHSKISKQFMLDFFPEKHFLPVFFWNTIFWMLFREET